MEVHKTKLSQNQAVCLPGRWSLEEFFHFLNALSNLLGSCACIQHHSRIYSIHVILKLCTEVASKINISNKSY